MEELAPFGCSGAPVDLTTVEFDLLAALMRVAGSTRSSREDLVTATSWGSDFSPVRPQH